MTSSAARVAGFLAPARDAGATDTQLLDRFVAHRDAPAFAALVARHGPMVFGVCRRIIRDWHAAEDAFQAAFLVLARKAQSVEPPGALAGWLHGVAVRVAKDARRTALRRHTRERPTAELPEPAAPTGPDAELSAIIDDELRRLPKKYRDLLIACDLGDSRRATVAAALGIPEGTLSSRLTTARKMLAGRLAKRGIAPVVAVGVASRGPVLVACEVPRTVQASTARLGCGTAGAVPVGVNSLAKGAFRAMTHRALIPVVLTVLSACGAIGALAASHDPSSPIRTPAPTPVVAFMPRPANPPAPKVAPKPLPKGPNKLLFYRNGDLTLINPDGKDATTVGVPEKFTVTAGFVALSPDGTHCADLLDTDIRKHTEGPKQPTKLFVRKLDKKEPWIELDVNARTFVWSPDGTEIACSEFENGPLKKEQRSVTNFVVNVRTKEKIALKFAAGHIITDWSRDGKYFLTTVESLSKDGPHARQYLMNRDGTEHATVGDATTMSGEGRLSPDGKRVLCWGGEGPKPEKKGTVKKTQLVVIDIATKKVTKVDNLPLNGEIHAYCWSPDGKRIAYTWRQVHEGKPEDIANKETESHLVISDPDGKNQKTIVTEKGQGQYEATVDGLDWR